MKPQLTDFPALQKYLEDKFPGVTLRVAAAVQHAGTAYVTVELEDQDSGGLGLYTVAADGAVAFISGDTVLFPLPGDAAVPLEVEKELALQLAAADGDSAGGDLGARAEQLRQGLEPQDGTRGLLDFLFGGGHHGNNAQPAVGLNAQLLTTCKAQVNVLSSRDAAGTNHGRLACVWAVNQIFRKTTGARLTSTLGTAVLYPELRNGKGQAVDEAHLQPGDLIISPTEGETTGHVGFVGEGAGDARVIYSNSSSAAVWQQNYTIGRWRARYVNNLGLKMRFFRLFPDSGSRLAVLPDGLGGRSAAAVQPAGAAWPEQLAEELAATDDQRRVEAALIHEFSTASALLEAGQVHEAVALALDSEARGRDDTSRRAVLLETLTPAMAAREERRWEGFWEGVHEVLGFGKDEELTAASEAAAAGGAPQALRAGPPVQSTTFETLRAEYAAMWQSIELRPERATAIRSMTNAIIAGKREYVAIQDTLRIPWYFTGIVHALEGSCNFRTHLHNGDSLRRRTVNVPAGRPVAPPASGSLPYTWHESAVDALKMKNYHQVTDWSVPAMLWRWERYNGFGSRRHGVHTAYLWSFSTHYTKGKYVRDGVWDPNFVSLQVGAAVLLKSLKDRGETDL